MPTLPSLSARLLRAAGRERQTPALSAAPARPRPSWSGRAAMTCSRARPSWTRTRPRPSGAAVRRRLAGWMPGEPAARGGRPASRSSAVRSCRCRIHRAAEAPTLLGGPPLRRSLTPLVQTYGTVPYADIDPTLARLGQLRADVRHDVRRRRAGAAAGRRGRRAAGRLASAGPAGTGPPGRSSAARGWPPPAFGLLYGECFGPTGLVPDALARPARRADPAAARRGSASARSCWPARTRSARSTGGGKAAGRSPCTRRPASPGISLFLGIGLAAGGWYFHDGALIWRGGASPWLGLVLAFVGFFAEAGRRRHRGGPGARWSCSTW